MTEPGVSEKLSEQCVTIDDGNNYIRLVASGAFDEKPAPGREIVSPFYHGPFDYVFTKITLNTIGGVSASTTYDEPFIYVGYRRAYKTNNITGAMEEMSYLDKIPFYILSTIYNIHCILIMMILFFGINYLYKKVEFQIN